MARTMEGRGCMAELAAACSQLDREGFWWRPGWPELRQEKRPPESTTGEPGEWKHGWQCWSSSGPHFRKTTMLLARSAASRAHFRSHSGHNAGAALIHAQFPGVRHRSAFVRVLLRARLQFPIPIDKGVSYRAPLGPVGTPQSGMPPHREVAETFSKAQEVPSFRASSPEHSLGNDVGRGCCRLSAQAAGAVHVIVLPCAELLDVVSLLGYVRFAWRWQLLRCLTSTTYLLLSVLTHAFMLPAVAGCLAKCVCCKCFRLSAQSECEVGFLPLMIILITASMLSKRQVPFWCCACIGFRLSPKR